MIFSFKVGMPVAVVNPQASSNRFLQLRHVTLDRVTGFDKYTGKRKLRPLAIAHHHTTPREREAMSSRCNESTVVHEGRVFALHRDRVTLPNGVDATLDVIRHPGAAAIVPVTEQGRVVLIRQFRYAVGGSIWEIPAGTMESGESPLVCAQRELTEEIGFTAARWHPLGAIMPVPAYSDEIIHLYRAEALLPAKQQLDADEILDVHEFHYGEALEMIRTGKIRDAKTIAGLMMAQSGAVKPLPR